MKQTQLFIEFCTNIEENEELQIIDFLHKSYNNFIIPNPAITISVNITGIIVKNINIIVIIPYEPTVLI